MAREKKKKKKGSKKVYLLTFFLTLLATLLIFGSVTALYIKGKEARYKEEIKQALEDEKTSKGKNKKLALKDADLSTLEGLIEASPRVNVLLLGTDGGRADTIILASYEPDNHYLDFVTIPRDTYNEVPGRDYLGQRKINAVFGFDENEGGGKGMKAEVSKILGVPIHYYVTADYESISAIVNTVGGVEVNIEQYMDYDDPYANPPLHIHFAPGVQTLNGQQAIEYLRWRKNNWDGGAGDVPRTQRQIDFLKRLIKEALASFKYDEILKTCYEYVETDMPIDEVFYYSTTLIGFSPDSDIESNILPGETFYTDLSYYGHFPDETKELMMKIYRRGLVKEEPKKEGETTGGAQPDGSPSGEGEAANDSLEDEGGAGAGAPREGGAGAQGGSEGLN